MADRARAFEQRRAAFAVRSRRNGTSAPRLRDPQKLALTSMARPLPGSLQISPPPGPLPPAAFASLQLIEFKRAVRVRTGRVGGERFRKDVQFNGGQSDCSLDPRRRSDFDLPRAACSGSTGIAAGNGSRVEAPSVERFCGSSGAQHAKSPGQCFSLSQALRQGGEQAKRRRFPNTPAYSCSQCRCTRRQTFERGIVVRPVSLSCNWRSITVPSFRPTPPEVPCLGNTQCRCSHQTRV
jgi:hypothetical protein